MNSIKPKIRFNLNLIVSIFIALYELPFDYRNKVKAIYSLRYNVKIKEEAGGYVATAKIEDNTNNNIDWCGICGGEEPCDNPDCIKSNEGKGKIV